MKKKTKELKLTTKLMLIDNLLYLFFGLIVYPLIPYLLNYPPNSIDNEFQSTVVGMQYTVQFIFIFILGIILNCTTIYLFFRKLNKWEEEVKKDNKRNILKIRDLCANGIYKLIPTQVITNSIILILVFTVTSTEFALTIKLTGIICIWTTIADLLLYVFSGKIFNNILKNTYDSIKDTKDVIIRLSVGKKMSFQYVSCLLVILFVMTLFGYSRIMYERGEFLKEKELNELEGLLENSDNLINIFSDMNNEYFVIDEKGNDVYNTGKLNKFAKEYILHFPDGNRLYYQYGSSIEGVFKKVNYEGGNYYVGKLYNVMPSYYTVIFLVFDTVLLIIYLIVIACFTRNLKYQLDIISTSLKEIGESDVDTSTPLPVTSNDEFSDLIIAYNSVQKNTQNFIKELKEKQEIIVKQGQLVSIGELAGGVAHDINTPISAIKTGILMLNTMEGQRTEEEKEILQRMDNCATKIINIVNSMRNQIRNLGGTTNVKFKIGEVVNDIKIITYHEVKKNNSDIVVDIQEDLEVQGDPTKLGQVLTNLVVNAAQAYGNTKGGKIDLKVSSAPNNMAMISITDYAGGLDESIIPYIFKNILTTKGTYGTGLGLYLAYSVIKGEFNGDITFDTQKGVGTTFYITIPKA